MGFRNHLLNQKGQILIESLFVTLMVASLLIVFSKLIEFQKSKSKYSFYNEGLAHVSKIADLISK